MTQTTKQLRLLTRASVDSAREPAEAFGRTEFANHKKITEAVLALCDAVDMLHERVSRLEGEQEMGG